MLLTVSKLCTMFICDAAKGESRQFQQVFFTMYCTAYYLNISKAYSTFYEMDNLEQMYL
jgi:hypothetical protein